MIYVTHDQTEALTFADTVVVMHDGAVVQSGTPEELFANAGPHLRRLFHRLAGHEHRAGGSGEGPRGHRIDGHTIGLDRTYDGLPPGAKIEIGVRPEFVEVVPPAPGLLSANIERIDDLGRVRFARVRIGDVKFAAKVPNGFSVPDNTAGLVFDPAHIHVYADSLLVEGRA